MTGYHTLRRKLVRRLCELPDFRANEEAPGMGMTWGQLAARLGAKHHKDVKALVRRAAEVGLIEKKEGGEVDGGGS